MKGRTFLRFGSLDRRVVLDDTLPSVLKGIGTLEHDARRDDYHVKQTRVEAAWMTSD